MLARKKKNRGKLLGGAIILFIAFPFFVFIFAKYAKEKNTAQIQKQEPVTVVKGDMEQDYADVNRVEINGQMKKISATGGNIENVSGGEDQSFSDFSGLPKIGENGNESVQQERTLFSQDRKNVLVQIVAYDLASTKKEDESESVVLRKEEYRCDVAQKKCESSNLFSQGYQGIEDVSQIWWSRWDAQKELLYGNVVGDDGQSVAPVYICDTKEKTCASTKKEVSSANVPNGFVSPSLNKLVTINQNDKVNEETGNSWELALYSSADLLGPLRHYDLSSAITKNEDVVYDSVGALVWDSQEEKIFFCTIGKIFALDINDGKLTLIYAAPADSEENSVYLDSSKIFLSADNKYVFFMESQELSIGEEESEMKDVLKKIDLERNNEVTEAM